MKILLLFIISSVFIAGCGTDIASSNIEKITGKRMAGDILYFNSFEFNSDTTGWTGIIPEMFINEAAPGCGTKSLHIGGGCIQPAGSIKLSVREAGYYSLSLWEKTPDTGGILNIIIDNKGKQEVKNIPLTSKDWKQHKLENLYFSKESTLTIDLIVGGFVYASAYIDELKIQKLD